MGIVIVILVLLLDQGSKLLVQATMTEGQSIPVIPNLFDITYIKNPGAAFGVLAYRTQFFVLVSLLVVGIIAYYYRKVPKDWVLLRIALAMQVGGALGNMIDRLRYGRVVDFVDFKVWPYIFNLADSAIVVGSCILALYLLRSDKREKALAPGEEQQSEG